MNCYKCRYIYTKPTWEILIKNFKKINLHQGSILRSINLRRNILILIFLRSLSGITLRDRIKSEEIRKKRNVEEMIDDIQNY